MLLLTDCPERLASLAPSLEGGAEVRADALPPADRDLWRVVGTTERPWRGTTPDPGPPGFWSRVLVVAEAPRSQLDALREALAAGQRLPGPTATLALTGRGFHGQRDRQWQAASGNLHLCAAFPDPGLAARQAPALPMLAAVAVVDAIREAAALRAGIKWVNDVLVEGRKVGGVLTTTQTHGDRLSLVLLGVGLNVAVAPEVPPTPFVPRVGCLAAAGAEATWADAAVAVLAALGRRLAALVADGPSALLAAYREASLVIGREVCVVEEREAGGTPGEGGPDRVLRGTVRAIAPDLSLVLEGVDGPVARGRLAFAEDCRGLVP
jgi:BirA family biotin operon repressor/biotin-[acetyl-CoA-carboxylase] ligase